MIAEVAKELGCDKVIMGTHGYGTVRQLLMGSISHAAIHQIDPEHPGDPGEGGIRLDGCPPRARRCVRDRERLPMKHGRADRRPSLRDAAVRCRAPVPRMN